MLDTGTGGLKMDAFLLAISRVNESQIRHSPLSHFA